MATHDGKAAPVTSYGTYLLVWLALLVLTALTVAAAVYSWGGKNIFAALLIAGTKSALVLIYFMHLRHEAGLFRLLLLITVFAIAAFIGITFTDVLFR